MGSGGSHILSQAVTIMKKTYVTSLPDHIGAFLKASKCLAELGLNITRVS